MRRLILALALVGLAGWQGGDIGAQALGPSGGIQYSGGGGGVICGAAGTATFDITAAR